MIGSAKNTSRRFGVICEGYLQWRYLFSRPLRFVTVLGFLYVHSGSSLLLVSQRSGQSAQVCCSPPATTRDSRGTGYRILFNLSFLFYFVAVKHILTISPCTVQQNVKFIVSSASMSRLLLTRISSSVADVSG